MQNNKRTSMKNRPLGFQIWIIITGFIVLMAIVVSITTIITINNTNNLNINIFDKLLFGNLFKLILCIIIISIIAAKMISNTVTEPIRFLERKVRLIANKKWVKNIDVDRKDEIGKLAYSIRKMQENLEKLDKEEEFFLQSISHELKTPIMVIKNYCQALRDEVYINDSKDETIAVIEEEVDLLGIKIGKLLYISSLDYVLEKEKNFTQINLRELVEHISERHLRVNKELKVELKLEDAYIMGIREKIEVAIENILENSIRYAKTYITIAVRQVDDNLSYESSKEMNINKKKKITRVDIINDGEDIPQETLNHLFDKFYKGKNGNFGLGLFITKRIVEFHRGNINVQNLDGVVRFRVEF